MIQKRNRTTIIAKDDAMQVEGDTVLFTKTTSYDNPLTREEAIEFLLACLEELGADAPAWSAGERIIPRLKDSLERRADGKGLTYGDGWHVAVDKARRIVREECGLD